MTFIAGGLGKFAPAPFLNPVWLQWAFRKSTMRNRFPSGKQKPGVGQMDFIWELSTIVRERGKLWIPPILGITPSFGGLIILGQTSVLTPFIHTLF